MICKLPVFCAVDLSRIPVLNDELSDIALIKKTVFDLENEVRALYVNLAATKSKNNWLINDESFPPLTNKEKTSITRNVTDPASYGADNAQMPTVISNDKISESSTSRGPKGQSLTHSSDNTPNYVDAVKTIPQDSDGESTEGFQVVKNKKRKTKFVVGSRQQGSQLQGVLRKRIFCISRLKAETTVEAVTNYLQSQSITVNNCFVVPPGKLSTHENENRVVNDRDDESPAIQNSDHRPKYVTMRLCVYQVDAKKILSAELWPLGGSLRQDNVLISIFCVILGLKMVNNSVG